jgi:hypothetical protein
MVFLPHALFGNKKTTHDGTLFLVGVPKTLLRIKKKIFGLYTFHIHVPIMFSVYLYLYLFSTVAFNLPNVDLAVLKVQLLAVSLELECPQGDKVDVVVVSIGTWIVIFGYNVSLCPNTHAVPNCVNPKLPHL